MVSPVVVEEASYRVKQSEHALRVLYTGSSYSAGTKADNSTGDYSITITPKFNTSKILVSFNLPI